MIGKLKSIIKQPTSYLGGGVVSIALEDLANGRDNTQTWLLLLFGLIGIFKNEAGVK